MFQKQILLLLFLMGGLGVGLGAFGAHALRDSLSPRYLEIWETAVFYLMIHTLAGIIMEIRHPGRLLGLLMLGGVFLFSGSLFSLVLSGLGFLGAITPLGGLLFIFAWVWAAWLEWRLSRGEGA